MLLNHTDISTNERKVITTCHDQVVLHETDKDVDHQSYFEEVQTNYVEALCISISVMHELDMSNVSHGKMSG